MFKGFDSLKALQDKGCSDFQPETFAKPPDVDAVQGVAAQGAQTYHIDRQASEQRTTQKCAADGSFAKVSA